MNYLKLPNMDNEVSIFDICQAHAQLESDYNVGGVLRERPSNQRRRESTSCQLSRLGFNPGMRWVDIYSEDNEDEDKDVRDIYIINALKMGLPITPDERAFIEKRFVSSFLYTFESWGTK